MAIPFKNFNEACKALPIFLYAGVDFVGQHKTIDDLDWLVQHEMDLATEGEPNYIECKRQSDTTKRWRKCREFRARCAATRQVALGINLSMKADDEGDCRNIGFTDGNGGNRGAF